MVPLRPPAPCIPLIFCLWLPAKSLTPRVRGEQAPWLALIAFGSYSLFTIGHSLSTFGTCPEAAAELSEVRACAKTRSRGAPRCAHGPGTLRTSSGSVPSSRSESSRTRRSSGAAPAEGGSGAITGSLKGSLLRRAAGRGCDLLRKPLHEPCHAAHVRVLVRPVLQTLWWKAHVSRCGTWRGCWPPRSAPQRRRSPSREGSACPGNT